MLTIERLRLTLPDGDAARAGRIGRLFAEELARLGPRQAGTRTRLALPPLSLPPGGSDRQVARHLARAVHRALLAPSGE